MRFFCIKTIRVLSKNPTLQHRGILYQNYSDDQLILRGSKVDVIESLTSAVKIERKGKILRTVPYGEVEVLLIEVSSKELMDALVPRFKKKYIPSKNYSYTQEKERKGTPSISSYLLQSFL
jgi:hypothetical protein